MSSDLIKNNAVCNYAILSRYNGTARLPLTLNNISVAYPVDPSYQAIPYFAGTGDYSAPDYNTLVKGSCYNYAGINQAYIDCSDPASSRGCNLTGGQCVTYVPRACDIPTTVGQPSFVMNNLGQCTANYYSAPDLKASPPRFNNLSQCMASARQGVPFGPTPMPSGAPSMMPPSRTPGMTSAAPSRTPGMTSAAPSRTPGMTSAAPSRAPRM